MSLSYVNSSLDISTSGARLEPILRHFYHSILQDILLTHHALQNLSIRAIASTKATDLGLQIFCQKIILYSFHDHLTIYRRISTSRIAQRGAETNVIKLQNRTLP